MTPQDHFRGEQGGGDQTLGLGPPCVLQPEGLLLL